MNEAISDVTQKDNISKGAYSICVFTNSGRTFKFSGVTNFNYTSTGFEFDYKDTESGASKHMAFSNSDVSIDSYAKA